MNFKCTRCDRTGRYPTWVTARWHNWTMHRCAYCGTAHSVNKAGSPEAISPPLTDIDGSGVLSPWFDARYRPYRPGTYQAESHSGFSTVLQWDGDRWHFHSQTIRRDSILKWRGRWENQSELQDQG